MPENKFRYEITADPKGYEQGFKRAQQATKVLDDQLAALTKRALAFGATALGVGGLGAIVKVADQYTLLDSKIKLVSKSTEEYAKVQAGLFEISQKTGSSFAENAANYSNLALALKGTNITSTETLKIFDLMNKSLVVAGASTAEASSFMLQFRQALGSGRLQGEEFRAMMESNSYFGNLLAKTLGVNVGKLKEVASEGKLTTDVLRKAFPEMANQIDSDFGKISKTISRAMTELQNAFYAIVADSNKSTEGTSKVAMAVSDLATTITNNKEALAGIFSGVIIAAEQAVKAIGFVGDAWLDLYRRSEAETKGLSMSQVLGMSSEEIKAYLDNFSSGLSALQSKAKEVADEIAQISKVREFEQGEGGWTEAAEKQYQALLAKRDEYLQQIEEIKSKTTQADEATLASGLAAAEGRANAKKQEVNTVTGLVAEKAAKVVKIETDENWTVLQMQKKKLHEVTKIEADEAFVALQMSKKKLKVYDEEAEKRKQLAEELAVFLENAGSNQLANELSRLERAYQKRKEIAGDEKALMADLNQWYDLQRQEIIEKHNLGMQAVVGATSSAFQQFTSDLVDGQFKSIGDAFKGLTDAMVQNWLNMIAQMSANSMTDLLFGPGKAQGATLGNLVDIKSDGGGIVGSLLSNVDWSWLSSGSGGTDFSGWESYDYYADGGVIKGGSGRKDDVYLGRVNGKGIMAKGGEYIMPPEATAKYFPILEAMRQGGPDVGFATGGSTSGRRATGRGGSLAMALAELSAGGAMTAESLGFLSRNVMLLGDASNGAAQSTAEAASVSSESVAASKRETDAKKDSIDASDALGRVLGGEVTGAVVGLIGAMNPVAGLIAGVGVQATGLSSVLGEQLSAAFDMLGAAVIDLASTTVSAAEMAFSAANSAVSSADRANAAMIGFETSQSRVDPSKFDAGYGDYGIDVTAGGYSYGDPNDLGGGGNSYGDATAGGYGYGDPDDGWFADGGIHGGGWRVVGERGPELEYTPPSRIFSNTDTNSILSGLKGGQPQQITIPVSIGNTALTTLVVSIADKHISVRERQGVTGRAYAR
jgi:tape measure domain-containing protein